MKLCARAHVAVARVCNYTLGLGATTVIPTTIVTLRHGLEFNYAIILCINPHTLCVHAEKLISRLSQRNPCLGKRFFPGRRSVDLKTCLSISKGFSWLNEFLNVHTSRIHTQRDTFCVRVDITYFRLSGNLYQRKCEIFPLT